MRNIFVRNYMCFAILIVISFTFAGGVFMAQVSRYSVQEKQEQLEHDNLSPYASFSDCSKGRDREERCDRGKC